MKICAIVAEFNPFHNGHKHLIDKIRKKGFTHIIAIMSGNYVQRGEPAIISKKARTKIALKNGIDLVVEIPCVWSISTAEKYAQAGVQIANSLGCVETLAFGSECGDIKRLKKITKTLKSEDFSAYLKNHLSKGITFAKAREIALSKLISEPDVIEQIKSPNNILGIEYLKSIDKFSSKLTPLTIERAMSGNRLTSASKIREFIKAESESYEKYVPRSSFEIISREIQNFRAPCKLESAEQIILYKLRTMNKSDILNLPDINEGLENRILSSVKNTLSLNDLLFSIKTKRYTLARIKRIILSAYLGITNKLQDKVVPYIRILGANNNGLEILKTAKSTTALPIVSRYADVLKLDLNSQEIFDAECRASDLYSLFSPKISSCGKEQTFRIVKI